MTELADLRNFRVSAEDELAVVRALEEEGPSTAPALAEQPRFRGWSREHLEMVLGKVWVRGDVSVDENDAFVALRGW